MKANMYVQFECLNLKCNQRTPGKWCMIPKMCENLIIEVEPLDWDE